MYEQVGGFKVTHGRLPPGDAGTRKTLSLMRELARKGALRPEVREVAIGALQESGARPHDAASELAALHRWVRDRVRFVRDIAGVETLQAPHYTLHLMAGDCDDRAVLLAAMIRSIGIPADLRFRVIAANRSRPRTFSHVYVMARIGRRDIALDPTYLGNPAGWQHPRPSRIGDFAL